VASEVLSQETSAGSTALVAPAVAGRVPQGMLIRFYPVLAAAVALGVHVKVPNQQTFAVNEQYLTLLVALLALNALIFLLSLSPSRLRPWLQENAPLAAAGIALVTLWEVVTLKLGLLPLPYFPGPDKVLGALVEDWKLIGTSAFYSLRLLGTGYLVGALAGLVTGILMGWSKRWHYWIAPAMKVIGPIPATAWIPLAMVIFPTSFQASASLVALAVWFPVTVMTGSGIANVRNAFFEVARTLGASDRFLVFRVALPAAFPTIFVGLFMGLGASFLVLIVAEMIGVKAGLGWYLSWVQGWAEYSKVYACLIVVAAIFSSVIALLFKFRDRMLVWQKGLIKW
jgi:NitT/TauT family transport system permease protein